MDMTQNPWFVMLLGMGTVFVGLVLLVFITKMMSTIIKKLDKLDKLDNLATPAPAAPAQPVVKAEAAVYPHEVDRLAFDAAVIAAIAAYTGSESKAFRITKITKR